MRILRGEGNYCYLNLLVGKKGQVWDTIIPWVIGIGILVIGFIVYGIFFDKGSGMINYLKDLLRFGR